ncbi:MAG: ACT domain-containing protein [Lactobacillales bacterium]|jgi:ACT domain-containing protein|nr:ACT domain-containing protein [Lactobacillales bacterium]
MKAVVTVVGKDHVGIVANVSTKLAELNLNIVDISQTLMGNFFTMMMMVEFEGGLDFKNLQEDLKTLGSSLGLKIRIQNEEIFDAMHKL